jgi:hypothetical protein
MQGTHLKRWTLRTVWFTDVVRRAIPWSRLIRGQPTGLANELNVASAERWKAVLAAGWLVLPWVALGWWPSLLPWLVLTLLCWWANRQLFALFRRRGGWFVAIGGFGLHQSYYVYSSAVFALSLLRRRGSP